MPKVKRLTIVLEGDDADLMDVVQTALAGGVLKEFRTEDVDVVEVRPLESLVGKRRYKDRKKRDFRVGDYVQVTKREARYGVEGGELGTITRVHYTGQRSSVDVRWDDNSESSIGGACLKLIRAMKEE